MDCGQILILLILLSAVNLVTLFLLYCLNILKIDTQQKLFFIKFSLVTILILPTLCIAWKFLVSTPLIIMTLPWKIVDENAMPVTILTSFASYNNWAFYLILLYSLGLCFMCARIIFSYWNTKNQLQTARPSLLENEIIFVTNKIRSPLSFGLPKANIYFPDNMISRWTEREIQLCLAHEKVHVEQYDSLWKLLSLTVQALLFFAPWAYLFHKKFCLEMEIFCDQRTCTKTTASIQEYSDLLLAMTNEKQYHFTSNYISHSTLKRRFLAMKTKKHRAPFLVSFVSAILFTIASIAMGNGSTQNEALFKITSKIFIDGKLISTPVILAKENQKAVIIMTNTGSLHNQGLRLELIATKVNSTDAIKVNFDVQYKNNDDEIHTKPQLMVQLHHESKIVLSSTNNHLYEMYVRAESA